MPAETPEEPTQKPGLTSFDWVNVVCGLGLGLVLIYFAVDTLRLARQNGGTDE